jgi:ribosomal protein S6--L-glutamate ligase
MNIAVLASPDSWYAADLRRAAGDRHEVVVLPFSEILAGLTSDGEFAEAGGRRLSDFSAVIVRTMPPGLLEQVIFRMDVLARCEAAGITVVNPPKAIEAAVDKYLASARLQAAGVLTPATIVCQTVEEGLMAFDRLGGDIVLKPLFGSEGRGITRITDREIALRAFKALVQVGAVLYIQAFIPHEGFDLRLFVLGEEVLGMLRRNPTDWRTNVSRGAVGEPYRVTEPLAEMARRAAGAVGALVAGVDLLPARSGEQYVLEVNAVPGWRALARTLRLDVARMVIDFVVERHTQSCS